MHVIIVHYACDTPVTRSAGPCDCPDLTGRSLAALQAPTDQFNIWTRLGSYKTCPGPRSLHVIVPEAWPLGVPIGLGLPLDLY